MQEREVLLIAKPSGAALPVVARDRQPGQRRLPILQGCINAGEFQRRRVMFSRPPAHSSAIFRASSGRPDGVLDIKEQVRNRLRIEEKDCLSS